MATLLKERNAIINRATIDTERGLTSWLDLGYGGTSQGFGGYILFAPDNWAHGGPQPNVAGLFIYRVIQIAGVERWDQVPGRSIRVRYKDDGGLGGDIVGIGHIVNNDWFMPGEEFQRLREEWSKPAKEGVCQTS